MQYTVEEYRADRVTMGLEPTLLVDKKGLDLRRRLLQAQGERIDQALVEAAYNRLLMWLLLGDPEPGGPSTEPAPDPPERAETTAGPGADAPKVRATKRGKGAKPAKPEADAAMEAQRANNRAILDKAKADWQKAQEEQAARHARRRRAYPDTATPKIYGAAPTRRESDLSSWAKRFFKT